MRGLVDPKDALFWFGTTDAMPTDQYFVVAFDESADAADPGARDRDIRAHIASRARLIPALNKRLVASPAGIDYPTWVHDELAIDDCVTVLSRAGSTWRECVDDIETLLGSTVDAAVTPWQLHIATGVADVPCAAGESTVVFVRLSHVLTDGLGGAALLRGLFGRTARPDDAAVAADALPALPNRAVLWAGAVGRAGTRLVRLLPALRRVGAAGRRTASIDAADSVPQVVSRPAQSINRCGSSGRRVAVLPIPAQFGASSRYTVTQLALTAVSSATENLLADRVESGDSLSAFVPVAFSAGVEWVGANRFVPAMVSLGGGSADLTTRAEQIRDSLVAERTRLADPDVVTQFRLSESVPWPILRRVLRRRARTDDGQVSASLAFTSVNCGDGDMQLLGSPAVMVAGFPCLSASIGVGIGLYGIGDTLTLGVLTSPDAIDDAEGFAKLLEAALADVAEMVDTAVVTEG